MVIMKKSCSKAIPFIQKAINALEYDLSNDHIKRHLVSALNLARESQKKRVRRNKHAEEFKKLAEAQQEKWWNMIKENAKRRALELSNEENSKNNDEDNKNNDEGKD